MRSLVVMVGIFSALTLWAEDGLKIHEVDDNGLQRFITEFELTPDNFVTDVPSLRRPQADGADASKSLWRFREGGQFDVFIKREWFPIQLPESCCNAYLILTMPYTNPRLEGGKDKIAAKRRLFDRIEKLSKADRGGIKVVVDLTAYAEVVSRKPLKIRLKDIQIYFRHSDGAYVGNVPRRGA